MKTVSKIIGLLLLIAVSIPSYAQEGRPDKKKMKACRQESKTYIKAEVMPTVKSWRAAFDTKLSADEKNTINSVRASLQEQREAGKAFKKQMHEQRKAGTEPTEEQKAQMKQMHEQKKALMVNLKPIMENHSEELKDIKTSNQGQIETWKTALEAIRTKHLGDKAPHEGRGEGPRGHHGDNEGKGHYGGKHGGKGGLKMLKGHHFLLLDPNDTAADWEDEEESDDKVGTQSNTFPNPATNQQMLSFDTKMSGNVKVELLDSKGNVIKTVSNQQKSAGSHSFRVDVNELPSNVYFYRITSPDGVETKRFMKK